MYELAQNDFPILINLVAPIKSLIQILKRFLWKGAEGMKLKLKVIY